MTEQDEFQTEQQGAGAGVPPSARTLLRVVYIMGVILVLLFLLLVGGIIWKATRPPAPKLAPEAALIDAGIPQGAAVKSMALDGDRLAIQTDSEIIVIDLRKREVQSRIPTNPK